MIDNVNDFWLGICNALAGGMMIAASFVLVYEGAAEGFDDDIVFTLPGDSHPFSGVYKGKKAMMEVFAKIPGSWNNFSVEPEFMISEGNKVFVKVIAKADGMNTIFGHYFEVNDEGKTIVFTAHDDTLSSKNAMI